MSNPQEILEIHISASDISALHEPRERAALERRQQVQTPVSNPHLIPSPQKIPGPQLSFEDFCREQHRTLTRPHTDEQNLPPRKRRPRKRNKHCLSRIFRRMTRKPPTLLSPIKTPPLDAPLAHKRIQQLRSEARQEPQPLSERKQRLLRELF